MQQKTTLRRQIENLRTTAPADRVQAAEELAAAAAGCPAMVEELVAALRHSDWHVRWGAAHALGKTAAGSAAPALRPLLEDPQPRVARTAAWALGRVRDRESTPALKQAIQSSNTNLAAAASWALGHIGTPEALEALAGALETASSRTLRSISIAFAEIGPEAVASLLTLLQAGSAAQRTRAAQILSRFGEHAARMLLPLLRSPEVKHRRAAAHVLGTLRLGQAPDPSLSLPIQEALSAALQDDDSRVRRSAARSVGALGFHAVRPDLEKLLQGDPDQIRVAANALAALGDPEAGPAIQAALSTDLPENVTQALQRALQKLGLAPPPVKKAPARPGAPLPTRKELPTHSDYLASVTPGLEAVAWEEIAGRLPGASLKSFEDGRIQFRWTGNPQAGAMLRSIRRLVQGGAWPEEIPPAKRLRRYRVRTVPASLEPTTAFALARLTRMGDRDVFVDPLCGAGTIALERALDGPAASILAGDKDLEALTCARENIAAGAQPVLLVRWDARQLPLADHSVSSIAVNLPFGRRSGEHSKNLNLYPAVLQEINRVLRPGGIAVVLTAEKRLLLQCLHQCLENTPGLQLISDREIEAGGLRPAVFVLQK